MSSSRNPYSNSRYQFVAGELASHCNPVTCILHARHGSLIVKDASQRVEGDVILIRPGVEHGVKIGGSARVIYFTGLRYPTNSDLADALRGRLEQIAMAALDGDTSAQEEFRARLSHGQATCPVAVADVVREISFDPLRRMRQEELACRLDMERTRALRAFKSATGMTFRGFKQWTGLQVAARRIEQGDRVTGAAMDGGFADAAHLTRTFRKLFGITPTEAMADKVF